MGVAVVFPWAGGCEHREAALRWVSTRYAHTHPGWELHIGDGATPGGFSRSRAIIAGASLTDAEVIVAADADVWCDGIDQAVAEVLVHGWAVPHRLIHRLSPESTRRMYGGADWHGLPLSTDNTQDSKPYVGNETGTLVVLRRDVLEQVPPDPRFVGWGSEDMAWRLALRCLIGAPWRGTADLVHCWHPPQARMNRTVGNEENQALYRRYVAAKNDRVRMRALVDEAKEVIANVA